MLEMCNGCCHIQWLIHVVDVMEPVILCKKTHRINGDNIKSTALHQLKINTFISQSHQSSEITKSRL